MKKQYIIFIIIPVFNRLQYTVRCIESLLKQSYTGYKIIVVDHGSTDGTSKVIENLFPSVVLLRGNERMWWTAATNVGITWALQCASKSDYILTLNNDLEVAENYLECLTKASERSKKSLVGSVSVDIENPSVVSFLGSKWNRWTAKYKPTIEAKAYLTNSDKPELISTDLLPGRGTLIPCEAIIEVGLFDEKNFPHYAADEDFSLRCKSKGFSLHVASNAIVYSHTKATGLGIKSQNKSLGLMLKSFSSIKSANNLRVRWLWAKRHTPLPHFYFFMDFMRILASFFRKQSQVG